MWNDGSLKKNCLHNQGYSFEIQYLNFVPIQYFTKYMVWTQFSRTFFWKMRALEWKIMWLHVSQKNWFKLIQGHSVKMQYPNVGH